MSRRILVTGGAGFIGARVVERLRREGHDARAGVRRKPAGGPSVACDLDDPSQIGAALAGVDVVVHAAYGASAAMEPQILRLLDAMRAADVRRLVHFSSIAVYGDATGRVREDTPQSALDDYGAAKIDCERRVMEWADAGHGRALILRPGIVYGRGSPFWIDKLSCRIRAGAWGAFGASGEGFAALVHVDDVAEMIARALARPEADAPLTIANVVGPQTPTWNDYFRALSAALGAPPLAELSPATLIIRGKLALAAKIWRKAGLPGFERAALAPTNGEMALFQRKADYRSDAAARVTSFAPAITMAEGLKRSL